MRKRDTDSVEKARIVVRNDSLDEVTAVDLDEMRRGRGLWRRDDPR